MGQLYAYRDKTPRIADTAVLFDSAEITSDVVVGAGSIIGAGVKIIGDSHGPVRIGSAPGCRSWRTPCCTCCPTTSSSSRTTSSSGPAR